MFKTISMACLKPSETASLMPLPAFNSSRTRSKIRMLASTERPMVSTIPAIPGSVSTAPNDANSHDKENVGKQCNVGYPTCTHIIESHKQQDYNKCTSKRHPTVLNSFLT